MNILGEWHLTVDTPEGKEEALLTFESVDQGFVGKFKSSMTSVILNRIEIDDARISWQFQLELLGELIIVRGESVVYESRIIGSLKSKFGTRLYVGEKSNIDKNNSWTTLGYVRALKQLETEIRILQIHNASKAKAKGLTCGKDLKLNVGCGPNKKKGWINIDLSSNADLQLDLRESFPMESNIAKIIYSEHFLEHLEFPDDAFRFLSESFRVLMPGGQIRIGVPDTQLAIESYVTNNVEYFESVQKLFRPNWCKTKLQSINFHFYQCGEHKHAYDFETLASVLDEIGFVDIRRREYDSKLDHASREYGTLYIDALKP